MFKRLQNLIRLPALENTEENLRARNLNTIVIATLLLTLLYLIYTILVPPYQLVIVPAVVLVIQIGLLTLIRIKKAHLAAWLFTGMLWLALLYTEIQYGGIRDTGFAMFSAVILIAGLTLGIGNGILVMVLTILAGVGLLYAEQSLLLPPRPAVSGASVLLSHVILFVTNSSLLYLAIRSMQRIALQSIENERNTRAINIQLEKSRADLLQQTEILGLQNRILNVVAEMASQAASITDEEELLSKALEVIQNHLPVEQVSIYLADESEQFLLIRASNREIPSPAPRIPIILFEKQQWFAIPERRSFEVGGKIYLIPETLSGGRAQTGHIVPLKTLQHFIGVLEIHFHTDTLHETIGIALQTLADQIAIALQNVRLSAQLQASRKELDLLAGRRTQSAWQSFLGGSPLGYQYDRLKLLPMYEQYPPEILQKLMDGQVVTYIKPGKKPVARLLAPLRLAGQTIGVIGYEEENPSTLWETEEITLLETIANQISLRLENTRLILEAQERAEEEKTLSQIAARIRETLDLETILQTAVAEIRNSYNLDEAEIRLQTLTETE